MPNKDPKAAYEQLKRWRAANPEKMREIERRYQEKNRDKIRETKRRYYEKNKQKADEQKRRWREENPEKIRDSAHRSYENNKEAIREKNRRWAEEHPEKMREYSRKYYANNPEKERERRQRNAGGAREASRRYRARIGTVGRRIQHWAQNHDLQPEDWAVLWDAQDGLCYLCSQELAPDKAHIDHDHRCCEKDHSCRYCRRGLAHHACNALIGMAADDPARLRRIADNLEIALKDTDARLALKPQQDTLLLALGHARPETTAGYTLTDNPEAAAAAEGLPVPARLRKVAG